MEILAKPNVPIQMLKCMISASFSKGAMEKGE